MVDGAARGIELFHASFLSVPTVSIYYSFNYIY